MKFELVTEVIADVAMKLSVNRTVTKKDCCKGRTRNSTVVKRWRQLLVEYEACEYLLSAHGALDKSNLGVDCNGCRSGAEVFWELGCLQDELLFEFLGGTMRGRAREGRG